MIKKITTMKKITAIIFCLILFVGCKKDYPSALENHSSYTIPIEKALDNLDQFLKQNDIYNTKTTKNNINTVYAIKSKINNTKTISNNDTLLYAVNFKNNGYAILAADSRINNDIIAITESGEIHISDFEPYDNPDSSEQCNKGVGL
ncbi:MAG: Spi family protease inhibitor [Candidatus Cryptobacteroides sp.]